MSEGRSVGWDYRFFPIPVRIGKGLYRSTVYEALEGAVDYWNTTSGVSLFTYEEVPSTDVRLVYPDHAIGTIVVEMYNLQSTPIDPVVGLNRKALSERAPSLIVASHIALDDNPTESRMMEILVHELGHALGLLHDPGDMLSIMYPSILAHRQLYYVQPEDLMFVRGQVLRSCSPLETLTCDW